MKWLIQNEKYDSRFLGQGMGSMLTWVNYERALKYEKFEAAQMLVRVIFTQEQAKNIKVVSEDVVKVCEVMMI